MKQNSEICFIADLHLSPEHPEIFERFQIFADDILSNTSHLFILGDLFDYWIGDDGATILGFEPVLNLLKKLSANGLKISIQKGNRDFLLGEDFANSVGAMLISDPFTLTLKDKTVLLSHGDRWCTEDKAYMQLREVVTNPKWQQQTLEKDIQERIAMAKDLRQKSESSTAQKEEEIMDVSEDILLNEAALLGADTIIHGHTHRPNTHLHNSVTRYVLGDWYQQNSWIMWKNGEFNINGY